MESEKALDAVDLICSSAELFADRKLVAEPLNNIAKYMFDSLVNSFKDQENRENLVGPLDELVVDESFEAEQIWEQISLQNAPFLQWAEAEIKGGISDDIGEDVNQNEFSSDEDSAESDEMIAAGGDSANEFSDDYQDEMNAYSNEDVDVYEDEDEEDIDNLSEDNAEDYEIDRRDSNGAEIKEDMFFNLDEMDRFVEEMEEQENLFGNSDNEEDNHLGFDDEDDEEDVDEEEEDDSEDEMDDIDKQLFRSNPEEDQIMKKQKGIRYSDFFEDPASDEKESQKSSMPLETPFQKQQAEIMRKIAQLEEENLAQKDWDMVGEVSAKSRPKDSLLTKHLDFEVADKVAPPITQEFNECIESIIRRRILDKAWDDVKKVAAEEPIPYKQKEELQSEKSELGLADLYEKEYVEKTTGVKESDEKLKSKHKELSEIFGKLCYQLDCLSNFHFTPKPVQKEVQIRSNVPAISLEEAIPITMSTASAVAPEELYKSSKAPIGETEITSDEKKSSRRASKRKFKKSEDSKNLVAEGIKNLKSKRRKSAKDSDTLLLSRHNVIKVTSDDKTEYSNSTAFFQKLQDQQSSKSQNNKKHQISSNIDSSETIPNRASRYRL